MSEQPQEITADEVKNASVEGQQDVGAQPAVDEAPAQEASQEEQPQEEHSLKMVGDRTDASGRALFPWESLPKTK